jgi:hypothetical protein
MRVAIDSLRLLLVHRRLLERLELALLLGAFVEDLFRRVVAQDLEELVRIARSQIRLRQKARLARIGIERSEGAAQVAREVT